MTWTQTPFGTIEEAHATAKKFQLKPSTITVRAGRFRSFTFGEGQTIRLMAQREEGGPVLERELSRKQGLAQHYNAPGVPSWKAEDRLRAGPWNQSSYTSLEEAADHYRSQFANPDNVVMLEVVLFRLNRDEYEYALDSKGVVWSRVISPDL